MNANRGAYVWMLLGAASFSVMAFTTNTLKETFTWQQIATMRTAIALVLTVALAKAAGTQLVLFRPGTLWIRSTAGSIALMANFYSITHYPISEVLALSNMFPLWVAILSWPMLGERPRWDAWVAVLLGVCGVFVLVWTPGTSAAAPLPLLPVATAILASLASAVAMLGLHQLKGVDTRAVVAHFSGVSLAVSGAALLWTMIGESSEPTAAHHWTPQNWSALALVGLAATAGQLFLTKAFASGPPAQVSVVGLSQIGFSILLEMTLRQRPFALNTLIGMILVVLPTAWVLLRPGHETEPVPADE